MDKKPSEREIHTEGTDSWRTLEACLPLFHSCAPSVSDQNNRLVWKEERVNLDGPSF